MKHKKAIASRALSLSGARSVLERIVGWSGVLILNYHRVGDGNSSAFDRGLWSADADSFADQVRFCKRHLDVISPQDLPRAVASGRGRYGMITFDDGYRDNHDVAFPILKAAGVPATFFVVTGFIDAPRIPWWDEIAWLVRTSHRDRIELPEWLTSPVLFDEPDREGAVRTLLRKYKALPAESTGRYLDAVAVATGAERCGEAQGRSLWMNWNMLREMRAAGMTIGAHTVTHPVLAQALPDRQREEIVGSVNRLSEELGEPIRYFSYPVGGRDAFNADTRRCLQEAGIQYAFSYYGGFRRFSDWDDYDVQRVPIETYLTPDWFRSIVALPWLFA